MDWILVSREDLSATGEGEVVMVVDSVDIVMFSVETYCVIVEGYMIRNNLGSLYILNKLTLFYL